MSVNYYKFTGKKFPFLSKISFSIRRKIYRLFEKNIPFGSDWEVLDVGVTSDTTQLESNFFEQLYPYKNKITALSIEKKASILEKIYPGLKFVQLKSNEFPFSDNQFDVVFCNATLEHVGSTSNQKLFIEEILRVGKRCFISIPNRLFPIEFHTFLPLIHYFPKKVFWKILKILDVRFFASEDNLNLLSARELVSLFPENYLPNIKVFKVYISRFFIVSSNVIVYVDKKISLYLTK